MSNAVDVSVLIPEQTSDSVTTQCVLVTSDTVISESLECGVHDVSAGVTNESHHNVTGITSIPLCLNDGVSAVVISASVDTRVDTGVLNELHHPAAGIDARVNDGVVNASLHIATGINPGATDIVEVVAAVVPDHPATGVTPGVIDVVCLGATAVPDN